MHKNFQIATVLLITFSLIASVLGLNISVHKCKATNLHNASFLYTHVERFADIDDCATCSTSNKHGNDHKDMEQSTVPSDCCDEQSDAKSKDNNSQRYTIKENCCEESVDYFNLDLETLEVNSLKIFIKNFVLTYIVSTIQSLTEDVKSTIHNKFLHCGLAPPYQFEYRHFLVSLTE